MKWKRNFEILKKYNDQYPESMDVYKRQDLESWISRRRSIHNNGEKYKNNSLKYKGYVLTESQIDKLNEINFIWDQCEYKWNQFYNLLKKYLKKHNNQYPAAKEIYEGKKLGCWLERQRFIYNNGEKQEDESIRCASCILTKKQIDKLNEINFIWNKYEYDWNQSYELLKKYLKENNGCYPKMNATYKGVRIGRWIGTQRIIYNNGERQKDESIRYNSGTLTRKQIDKLNEINFIWIVNISGFKKRTITTKGQLEGTRRYLQSIIDKLENEKVEKEELNKQLLLRL